MDDREKVAGRLHKKELEIHSLEEKLKAARIYAQALADILILLAEAAPETETSLKAGSAVAQAREVIRKRGSPVHITDLLQAIGKVQTRESRASLTSSLAAYVRKGEIFTRPAPNTFGLVELGHVATESVPMEPPSGFGNTGAAPAARRLTSADLDDEIPF